MRTPTRVAYAGIICRHHGKVDIDQHNYQQQMANTSARWACPLCGDVAEFDDDRYEQLHPEE